MSAHSKIELTDCLYGGGGRNGGARMSESRPVVMPFEGPLTDYQAAILRLIGPTGEGAKAEYKRRQLRARLAGLERAPRRKQAQRAPSILARIAKRQAGRLVQARRRAA